MSRPGGSSLHRGAGGHVRCYSGQNAYTVSFITSAGRGPERLPLSGEEVLNTYLYAYIWLPPKLFIPPGVIIFAARLAVSGAEDGSTTPVLVYGLLSMIWPGYVLFVLSSLPHRTRGAVE